jgi:LuxR family maltose regulon positive regulatory protein
VARTRRVGARALGRLTRVRDALGDRVGALAALQRAVALLQVNPDAGDLPRQAADIARDLGQDMATLADTSPLTEGQLAVLRMLRGPLSGRDIARTLGVSMNTFKTQRRLLYRRLGVSSRDEAVAWAARHGM